MQVVLNRRDKEQLVIKLHNQGKTIREIASAAHLSFTDIGSIIRKIDGRNNVDEVEANKDIKNKSKDTQALFLFSTGKKPIDVSIELDLSASEVQNILEEFWALNELHDLAFVYNEIKSYLPSFLKLFHCLKERRMLDEKGKQISSYSKYFTSNGIRQIVNDGSNIKGHYNGVKQAECRTEIQY